MRARSVVIIVLILLALAVVAQNTQVVAFRLWLWDLPETPITSLLAGSLVVGILIGFLLGRPWKRRRASVAKPRSTAPRSSHVSEDD
jgi:uncharacterized integral membrane protein